MKTRMKHFLWAIAFCVPISSQAQNTISGIIKTEKGDPIEGAKVYLKDYYSGDYSNEKGEFLLKSVKNGSYTLITSYFGYEVNLSVVKVESAAVSHVVVLKESTMTIEEMYVTATRANDKTPTTYANLDKEEIENKNFGQDLPFLLNTTPSTVVSSDAGAGIGYTGVRIRGVDPSRTNVTINGIPINDSESHSTYWVNMPDFASSTNSIQVQRGVGTSTNGAAAFGASINIKSDNIEEKAYAGIDNSIGSFNTLRTSVKAGTGLINNKFTFDTRLSRIVSDGFIDRASSNLKSFYMSGAWIGKKSLLKANVFVGRERTYQAWNGVPEAKYNGNSDSLLAHFNRNNFPGGIYQTTQDSINLFDSKDRNYNYYLYQNEVDDYQQDHYQLHFTHTFSERLTMNIAGHYTFGRGFYEQFRQDDDLSDYGINPFIVGTDTITTSDVIRRRWLKNHFYGGIFSLNYSVKNLKILVGAGANNYEGEHFGEVTWARIASNSEIGDRYYESKAQKTEVNGYVKANYQLKKFNFFLDLQVRNLDYSFVGMDDSYGELIELKQSVNYTFFNPKLGFMVDFNKQNNVYASFSIANREPVRGDFVENIARSIPKPEQLQNLEVGYRFTSSKFLANANYYWMNYKDQLILTGQINDVGSYTRTNVAKSFRSGIELELAYKVLKSLSLSGNLNISQNKIAQFTEFIDNYDNYDSDGNMIQDEIQHSNTDIAFSPNAIAGLGVHYSPIKNLDFNLYSKYVGSQFLDNTSSENRKLDGYFTSDFNVNYKILNVGLSEIVIGVMVNNLFNAQFVNNGYTWGYVAGGQRTIENFFFPQAGRNFLVRLALKF